MKDSSIFSRSSVTANIARFLLFAALLFMTAQPVYANNPAVTIYQQGLTVHGKTVYEWTSYWWKYVLSFPADTNPLADPTGSNCTVGQSGPVFFLAGTSGGSIVRNDCVVPSGKAILFPVVNVIAAVPEDGTTFDEIKSLATNYMSHTVTVDASIDGVKVDNLMANYRFPSPSFSFNGANPGIFDPYYEGQHKIAFSDGWWVMLAPLQPGAHRIYFKGHLVDPDYRANFTTEVTYNLIVK
jgi:hypothetical protein